MTSKPPQRNWFKIGVHAFCGAVVGAMIGLRVWLRSHDAVSPSLWPGVIYIGGGALVVGLIAGLAAESGWDER